MATGPHLQELLRGVLAGDAKAMHDAFTYLEADPYEMYSGFDRGKVAGRLARAPLDAAQRERGRNIVVATIDRELHVPFPHVARLAGAVADNGLRRDARARLHSYNDGIASRALRVVVHIKRPGYTPEDLAAARAIVLREMRSVPMPGILYPSHARLARRLCSPEWVAELRDIAAQRGPDRAAAKVLLAAADARRRTGP